MQQQALKWFAVWGLLSVPQLAAAQNSEDRPSLALLEYLGSLVDSEDGLIGPEVFIEDEVADEHEKSEKQTKQEALVPEVSDDD